jgi:hypothetical protein
VTLVFTDQPAGELSGTVTTGRGQPAASASVIVFPADRQLWTNVGRSPRHLRAVAVGSGARFRVTNLPAGSYLVAATLDSRPAWADPKFLDSLTRAAQKISIADGEKRTLDLRLPAGEPAPTEARARAMDPGGDGGRKCPRETPHPPTAGTGVIAASS